MHQSVLDTLNWRYATKKFDPTKLLDEATVQTLIESMRLAPSASGIQPWKFFVVENKQLRSQIRAVAYDQSQVTDASHLFVLARKTVISQEHVEHHVSNTAQLRNIPRSSLDAYYQMVWNVPSRLNEQQYIAWSTSQVFIALGFLLFAAATMRVDTCPMEGFDHAAVDSILKFPEQGLAVSALCPVGYRAADDGYSAMAKSRFALAEVVAHIT